MPDSCSEPLVPKFFVDELQQTYAWSYWRNHYIVGLSADKAEALSRWNAALKEATR